MAAALRTIRVRFSGDTRGLAAAAKRGERVVDRFGKSSARRFVDNFEHEFNRGGIQMFARAAGQGVTAFGVALQGGALRNPQIAGALGAAVLAGLLVGMPVIGSLAAGAFVTAFGAGLAGLGLVFAGQAKFVKDTFKAVADETAETMRQLAKPFESTLIIMIGAFQAFFASIAVSLRDAFARMAPAIESFVGNLFRALGPEGLGKVIGPVSEAFSRLLGAIGPRLPRIMSSLADAIIAVADSIADNPDTFAKLIEWLFSLVSGAIRFIAALSRLANWFESHPNVTAVLITALKLLLLPLKLLIDGFRAVLTVIQFVMDLATRAVVEGVRLIKRHWDDAIAFVESIPDRIVDAFGDPGKLLRPIGAAIVGGLAGGIRSAAADAADAAVDAARGALDAAKNWLGIGSPSKRAAREVGFPTGQGVAVGLRNARRVVSAQAVTLAGAALPPSPVVAGTGMTIENVNVRAFTDRFSLRQVQDELALHGVA